MSKLAKTLLGAALALSVAAAALAHHSGAMFDDQTTVEISGTVKEFQYTNPHSWLIVDVQGSDGSITTWGFEARDRVRCCAPASARAISHRAPS